MRPSKHPLAKESSHEISTFALINQSLNQLSLTELEEIEKKLSNAVTKGLLPQHGRSALVKLQQTIAKRRVEALFTNTSSSTTEALSAQAA